MDIELILITILTALTTVIAGLIIKGFKKIQDFVEKTETKVDDKVLQIILEALQSVPPKK